MNIFQVEYNEADKKDVIMSTISKMVVNRKLYDNSEFILDEFRKSFDHDIAYFEDKDAKIAVKFLFRKINTIRKVDDIEDFLNKYSEHYKFIIVSSICFINNNLPYKYWKSNNM